MYAGETQGQGATADPRLATSGVTCTPVLLLTTGEEQYGITPTNTMRQKSKSTTNSTERTTNLHSALHYAQDSASEGSAPRSHPERYILLGGFDVRTPGSHDRKL